MTALVFAPLLCHDAVPLKSLIFISFGFSRHLQLPEHLYRTLCLQDLESFRHFHCSAELQEPLWQASGFVVYATLVESLSRDGKKLGQSRPY